MGCVKLPSYRRAQSARNKKSNNEGAWHQDGPSDGKTAGSAADHGLFPGNSSGIYRVLDEAGEVILGGIRGVVTMTLGRYQDASN